MDSILQKLLRRGDSVAIERGRLVIRPASGLPVPEQWLADNRLRLCREVLELTGLDAFEYVGYDTGHYGKSRAGGVTLQFVSVLSGEAFYAVFNVGLKRERSSKGGKKGDPLPRGQFNPPRGGEFIRFWLSTGLTVPNRLPKIYKHMGILRRVLLTGERSRLDGRLEKKTIALLEVSAEHIRIAALGDNAGTVEGQGRDNEGTRPGDKETRQSQTQQGSQPFSTTCVSNHGNTVIREDGCTVAVPVPNTSPEDQSVDDWLKEYDQASSWN